MIRFLLTLILSFFFFVGKATIVGPVHPITDSEVDLSTTIVDMDYSSTLSLEQVWENPFDWNLPAKEKIHNGYFSFPKWHLIIIENSTDEEREQVIFVENNLLHDIRFYALYDSNVVDSAVNGNKYKRSEHGFDHRYPVFPIKVKPHGSTAVYIYVDNKTNSWPFPIKLADRDYFFKKIYYDQFSLAIYYGFILLIIAINVYLYTRIKRKVLLYYICYLICFVLFQALKDGYLFEFFFYNLPGWNFNSVTFLVNLSIVFNILFFQSYFNSKAYIRRYHYYLNVIVVLAILIMVLGLFDFFNEFWMSVNSILVMITMVSVAFGGVQMLKKRRDMAVYYLVGYGILFIGIISVILGVFGIIANTMVLQFTLKITTVLEIMILTIAIVEAFRNRQKDILELALAKQKEVTRLSHIANKELEKQVELNKKMAASEMKALRAQMNPHFTFNSMNSIQLFLINNDSEEAQRYLTKFSRLMRLILEHSKMDRIYVSDEIEALGLYMELEALRFKEKFEWSIEVDEDIEPDMDQIPSMLVQPFIENAIWHGLIHKTEGVGRINVKFAYEETKIVCSIEDNGIGREAARKIKEASSSQKKNKSMGMQITSERLELLNELLDIELHMEVQDLEENSKALGTRVEIHIPIN